MATTEDTVVVHLDRATAMLVDAFRDRSMFRPSRRAAIRGLLRQALRAHEIRAAKSMAPAAPAPHCAETPTWAPAGETA
jgi:hypothetical protein